MILQQQELCYFQDASADAAEERRGIADGGLPDFPSAN
jgi:hypothetical protein